MCLLTYSPFWMSLKITILYLQQCECVCVCVCVTERETVLMNSPLCMCSIVSPAFHIGLPGVSNPAPGELPSYRFQLQPQSNTPEPANHSLQGYLLISDRCVGAGL